MRWLNSKGLHAHSADAVVQSFCASLKSWRKVRKGDKSARPPHRFGRYFKVIWKGGCVDHGTAIHIKNGNLMLSNGRGNEPLIINNWRHGLPKFIEMIWDGGGYELRCVYKLEAPKKVSDGSVAGIDLGEINLAAVVDDRGTMMVSGRLIRSKRRYQNKIRERLNYIQGLMREGSSRYERIAQSRRKQSSKLSRQIVDVHHKQTTRLVHMLHERGVGIVVIGDVRGIQAWDRGRKTNQQLNQWAYGESRRMIRYKCERLGMESALQEEGYTSQTCPACGFRHKPNGRVFQCPSCGLICHRDVVGATNIRVKYLGERSGPVVGAMASPIGVRFRPHMRCSAFKSGEFVNVS
jgi:putative transposase